MISVASKPKRSQHRTAHKRKHYAKTRAIYCVACSLCPEVEKQFLFYKSLTLHVSSLSQTLFLSAYYRSS